MNKLAVAMMVAFLVSASASAETGKNPTEYEDGDTVLSTTKDKFKIEVRGPLLNPGNSTRVYLRPRNGNCTAGFSQ